MTNAMNAQSLGLRAEGKEIWILDQRWLPLKEEWIPIHSLEDMIYAIKNLQVRGAPLIGVAAAFSLAQLSLQGKTQDQLIKACLELEKARPTAVNLMLAVARMRSLIEKKESPELILNLAQEIFLEDVELCRRIADFGQNFVEKNDSVLTHCNSGGLATAGIGTALGVLRRAHELGKNIHVWVDETRPLLQGARLTAWECEKFEIPYTLICDNMAGHYMAKGKINRAITGADRIATNGDFANKIGTYSVAINCKYHKIPFAVAAPLTTLDSQCLHGNNIPIEERIASEVKGLKLHHAELNWAPHQARVGNPAFDVTPAELVDSWVLDTGLFKKEDIHVGRHWWIRI